MKKINLIIDTDPGVDDLIAIISALYDKRVDIKLFTTVSGNVDIDTCTKNLLHILEICKKNIPVAKGAAKPLIRDPIRSTSVHGPEGLGKHKITEDPKLKPIDKNAIDAMYETICKNKGKITLVLLGPHTNIAKLLIKYPDVKKMIKKIIFEGTSDYGKKKITPNLKQNHVSFNASSDPEALKIVLESGIPIVVIPSEVGRAAHLTEDEVLKLKEYEFIGGLLYELLDGYWEPGIEPKVVSLNDACALLYLRLRHLFLVRRANIILDTEEIPGRTFYKFKWTGKYRVVTNVWLKKLHKFINKKK